MDILLTTPEDLELITKGQLENLMGETVLLVPATLGSSSMRSLICLLKESIKVLHASNCPFNLGLLYHVRGRCADIQTLIDLGCIEWE